MPRPELGTKRVCPVTGRKFYDLNKDPIISPYTGQVVPVTNPTRGRPEVPSPATQAEETEVPEPQEAELISLEDADAETAGTPAAAAPEDAEEDEVIAEDIDDTTFLEEDEEEDDDVSDIIGGDIEDEEET